MMNLLMVMRMSTFSELFVIYYLQAAACELQPMYDGEDPQASYIHVHRMLGKAL